MVTSVPRGIRNANPGNIRIGDKWQGMVAPGQQSDNMFCQFKDATWGIRAMATILISYQDRYKLNTIREVIDRWAPVVENNTEAYIQSVCNVAGRGPDDTFDMHAYDMIKPIIEGIIQHENGHGPMSTANSWYSEAVIDTGLQRAGVVNHAATVTGVPVTKETVGATATATVGVAQLADVAPQVMSAMQSSQDHISSGSTIRIVFGVATIALAGYIAWSQIAKHRDGVVA